MVRSVSKLFLARVTLRQIMNTYAYNGVGDDENLYVAPQQDATPQQDEHADDYGEVGSAAVDRAAMEGYVLNLSF